jgi:type IV pilus secretin PilQ/predicted competence protein
MSNRRRRILAAFVALWILPCLAYAAAVAKGPAGEASPGEPIRQRATSLDDLAVSPGEGGPSVVLLGNGPIDYESFLLEGPDRLVLDLKGVVSHLKSHQFAVPDSGVARVRAGQYRLDPVPVTRIVFDLESGTRYRIDRQDERLVVQFGAKGAADARQADAADDPVQEALAGRSTSTADPQAPASDLPARADDTAAADQSAPRSVGSDALESLLQAPSLAAPAEEPAASAPPVFETKTILTEPTRYNGKKISLNLVDADVKQVFRLFHEISGLNFVLDPSVEGRVTIVLDQVPWDQALDIILNNNGLDKQLDNNVIRIATTQKLATEAASRRQLKEAKELEVEPITITKTLSYAKAKDVERVIRDGGVLSARGKVIIDERTNTLIISDIPKKVEPLDQLISTLDSETPQVMIEARIVETSREFVQDFGVKWGFAAIADASRGTAISTPFPHNAAVRYGLNLPGGGGASTLNFKFGNILDSLTLDVTLNALETEGRGRILSSPKIATQNNERAEIEQGVRIPIVNTTATEINVEFVSASLRLAVTPQITAEGTIILDIQVENNSPDFAHSVQATPPINTQRAQTKLLVSDGGTTVIGGIFTVNESRSESGVPWFRKLPIFGWLFKNRNITNENRELLIFITPKIMRVS